MDLPYTLEPYVQYVHINSFGNQGTTQLIVPDVFIVVGIPSMVFNNPIDIFVMNDVSRSKKMHMLSYIPCTLPMHTFSIIYDKCYWRNNAYKKKPR